MVVRRGEEVCMPLEDGAETAEALAHSASHRERNRNVSAGKRLQEREEEV